jgi:hypothetical protein
MAELNGFMFKYLRQKPFVAGIEDRKKDERNTAETDANQIELVNINAS